MLLLLILLLILPACDVFRGGDPRPKTALSERAFIDVYVELARAGSEAERSAVLKKHGTDERELKAFVRAYTRNLPALSEIFDSIVARTGAEPERRTRELPPMLQGR